MESLNKFINIYLDREHRQLRMGQLFICMYWTKESWPELFYETSDTKCVTMIKQWLQDNHYCDSLPQVNKG